MTSHLSELLVFIGSSILLVPLFRKLGFGSILGYLIAGIIVGPYAFKLINDSESVSKLSEFGVVFLLFVIGLEIQPSKLWSMRKHLIGLGGLQVLLTAFVFFVFGIFFGLSPFTSAVLGFALSLSSTAFAVQYLAEKNVLNTEVGRSSFAILLSQDLFAIPALAIIPALVVSQSPIETGGHGSPNVWLALLVIAGLIVTSRYLMRPIFRLVASVHSRDLFTAVTLFVVLGVAALMELVGLSAALGTFIAGVLLADSEYRNELEANLEPFKALLMGLFFITVGMGVNLNVVVSQPFTILGLTIGYMVVKSAIIYFICRLFNLNHTNSKGVALAISQGGEFAFVIFGIITQLSMVNSETLAILTVVITASMALSPVISFVDEKLALRWQQKSEPKYDEIKDEYPEVIIAGFGRFGQIFGRILRAQGIQFVAIDHDADQIDLLRKFGNKVYYGDASRHEILLAAGAEKAKYFILAIDNTKVAVETAEVIQKHFPHLKVFARARNRGHVFDYMELGIKHIKRETIDSSIYFVRDLFVEMGFEKSVASRIVEKFREHDELMMIKQFSVRKDDESLYSLAQQGTAQLAEVMREESLQTNVTFQN